MLKTDHAHQFKAVFEKTTYQAQLLSITTKSHLQDRFEIFLYQE